MKAEIFKPNTEKNKIYRKKFPKEISCVLMFLCFVIYFLNSKINKYK